jgi:hypothetical protein
MIEPRIDAPPPDALRTLEILKRAALRAREVARATGTKLVIYEDGVTKLVTPEELDARDITEQAK